jgi:HSP20 family protein
MHKGFDGLMRGLGDLLQVASNLAERTGDNGVFDLSVRVGGGPVVTRTDSLHRQARSEPENTRGTAADLFDEDDHYLVVVELPGVAESAVQWSVRDDRRVVIRAHSANRTYSRDIALGSRVDPRTAAARFGNGVLELRVWKQRPR